MDGGSFQRVNVDPERDSWLTYGEAPVEVTMSDEQALPLTTRETIDAWLEAGWATPDTPDWLSGGYVTKERAQTALRMLADRIDALSDRLLVVENIALHPMFTMTLEGRLLDQLVDQVAPENVHPEVPTMSKATRRAMRERYASTGPMHTVEFTTGVESEGEPT